MVDLEDVLSNLDKFKESMKKSIEFIDLLLKLFGTWDATADMVGDDSEMTLNDVLNRINDVLIYKKE